MFGGAIVDFRLAILDFLKIEYNLFDSGFFKAYTLTMYLKSAIGNLKSTIHIYFLMKLFTYFLLPVSIQKTYSPAGNSFTESI